MSILDRFFKGDDTFEQYGWKVLTQAAQLEQIVKDSHQKPVVIFKHSVRCGISAMAKFNLEKDWDFTTENLDFYYLDIFAYRPISNLIAEKLGVVHQSPQLIVLKNGVPVFDTSHHLVNVGSIKQAITA